MTKKTFTALLIAVIGLFIFGCGDNLTDHTILRAVPTDAGLIIKTSHLNELCTNLNENNTIWKEFKKIDALKPLVSSVATIHNNLKEYSALKSIASSDIVISMHKEGKDKISVLFATMVSKNNYKNFCEAMTDIAKKNAMKCGNESYDGYKIYKLVKNNSCVISFAYIDEILVGSTSKLTTESAIRHLKSGTSISNNSNLNHLLKTEGKNSNAVLIANYKNLTDLLRPELSQQIAKNIVKIEHQGEWAVLDLNIQKQTVTCSGYSNFREGNGHYLRMLEGQKPVSNDFVKFLPNKTTYFISLGISNMRTFKEQYIKTIRERDNTSKYTSTIKEFGKYGVDIENEIYEVLENRITEFKCDYNLAGHGRDQYIIAKINKEDKMEQLMKKLCSQYAKSNNIQDNKAVSTIKSNTNKTFNIYAVPAKNLFNSFFGDLFTCEPTHYVCYNGMAIFGCGVAPLIEYINSMEVRKILSQNTNYNEFCNIINKNSNIYYYVDIAFSQNEIKKILNKQNANDWIKNSNIIKNFRSVAMQISCEDNNEAYTNTAFMYSNNLEADRYLCWIAPVDSTISIKPQVVKNHINNDREVITIDDTYKLYLFDKEGKRLFKKQLPGPLAGSIYQIDIYQNNKLQYLLATENMLHLIDRNGNYVEPFPVKLPANIASEISLYDYENNGNYRIFVPCTNGKIYLYTKDGRMLDGWTPLQTREPLVTPVQYFKIGQNDYLVCSDNLKTYIYNRRGEVRINVTNNFPKSKNSLFYVDTTLGTQNARFLTTNSSGEIVYISMSGQCKTQKIRNYTANHYFVLHDINGDGKNEYIFTDENTLDVFNYKGEIIFSQYPDGMIGRPSIFRFSAKDTRIGVTCRNQNKIYLYDNTGKICGGFPLQGISEFSISKLNSPDKYSVITGSSENFLHNYLIN